MKILNSGLTTLSGVAKSVGKITDTFHRIPRNELYRVRDVTLTYVKNDTNEQEKIVLSEVNTVQVSSNATVALGTAVVSPIIQPWYFSPFRVDITGKSYIGAYTDPTINVGNNNDIQKLMELRQHVNRQFRTVQHSRYTAVELFYGDPRNETDLNCSVRLRGFIEDIQFNESDSSPFIKLYTIKFIGEESVINNTQIAIGNCEGDQKNLPKRQVLPVTAGIDSVPTQEQAIARDTVSNTDPQNGETEMLLVNTVNTPNGPTTIFKRSNGESVVRS